MTTVTAPRQAVVTGDTEASGPAEPETDGKPALKWVDRPLLVYVCDDAETCEESEKFEDIVLADEKVAVGTRAFRCLKMTPSQVDEDAILTGHGKSVPRILVVEPTKLRVKVLESRDLKASKLFRSMKRVAAKFWKESLDSVVKKQLKLLTEQDKLANAARTLADKETRAAGDEKKLAKLTDDKLALEEQEKALQAQQQALWKLTPRAA